jgi:hypothetical protein
MADTALLKAQPPPAPVDANDIASKFVHFSERVLSWVGKQLDTFVTELMKASGKVIGTAIGLSPLWLTFGHQLTHSCWRDGAIRAAKRTKIDRGLFL